MKTVENTSLPALPCKTPQPRAFKDWVTHIEGCTHPGCRRCAVTYNAIRRDILSRAVGRAAKAEFAG